jgi:hypothetical protein
MREHRLRSTPNLRDSSSGGSDQGAPAAPAAAQQRPPAPRAPSCPAAPPPRRAPRGASITRQPLGGPRRAHAHVHDGAGTEQPLRWKVQPPGADATAYLTVTSAPRAPALYFYKLFMVCSILGGFLCTFASPFVAEPLRHKLLMVLAVAVGWNALCGIGQVVRMLGATLRLRRKVVNAAVAKRGAKALLDYEPGHRDQGLYTRLIVAPAMINHVFIIPNYKEDLETLSGTLNQLASHPSASGYTIVLAMEANEAGGVDKAVQLQEAFRGCFRSVLYTIHTMQHGEMPGKASNVNAAVRQFYSLAKGDKDSYMLTIIDADALVPYLYVQELDAKAAQVRRLGWDGMGCGSRPGAWDGMG